MGEHPAAAIRGPSPAGRLAWRPVPFAVMALCFGGLAALGMDLLLRGWMGDDASIIQRWLCLAAGLVPLGLVAHVVWGRDYGVGWALGARDPGQRARDAASSASWLSLIACFFWLNACLTAYFWASSATDPRPWAVLVGGLGLLPSALAVRSCLEPARARPTAVGALVLCAGFNAIPAAVVAGAILEAPSVAGLLVVVAVLFPSGLCLLALRRVLRQTRVDRGLSEGVTP